MGLQVATAAIVHDWLVSAGGAERVLAEIAGCLPGAKVHTIVDFISPLRRKSLGLSSTTTSFVQRLPLAKRYYWYYAPLMPLAVEQFDLSGYDIVVTSSHAFAKGVLVAPDQLHISYVHSPMRFAWDLQSYYLRRFDWEHGLKRVMASLVFHHLRNWDSRTGQSPDLMICPSSFIKRRIQKVYRRPSLVVHPPVDTQRFSFQPQKDSYYLTASFMNPFKALDVIVEAFRCLPNKHLMVIGDGPAAHHVRSRAGTNVTFLGRVPDAALVSYMQSARAFLFAAPEDFGIVMAEAQSCGTPVIAYRTGGASEIVQDLLAPHPTGVLFDTQSPSAVACAIELFENRSGSISAESCRINAMRFDVALFRARMTRVIEACWEMWSTHRELPTLESLQAAVR